MLISLYVILVVAASDVKKTKGDGLVVGSKPSTKLPKRQSKDDIENSHIVDRIPKVRSIDFDHVLMLRLTYQGHFCFVSQSMSEHAFHNFLPDSVDVLVTDKEEPFTFNDAVLLGKAEETVACLRSHLRRRSAS